MEAVLNYQDQDINEMNLKYNKEFTEALAQKHREVELGIR